MSLLINEIKFHNFRNYDELILSDIQPTTVFVGENAVGKTNIIEGIELLTSLHSFRHASSRQLIKSDKQDAHISITSSDEYRHLQTELTITNEHKNYYLNKKKKPANNLRGILPSVIFTPDDLVIVKGSQSIRRNELDILGSQLSKNYGTVKRDYENVLRHKNKLLKEEAPATLLEAINEMIITCGAQLSCYRSALLAKFEPYITQSYQEISSSKEKLSLCFNPSWIDQQEPYELKKIEQREAREQIEKKLSDNFSQEIQRKRCLIGPHLDTIYFYLNGKDASVYGSQGQQRSIVLAYRLAELQLLEDFLQQRPILLLDDVMSELDAQRRNKLIEFISRQTQVFITTTTLSYFTSTHLENISPIHLPLQ